MTTLKAIMALVTVFLVTGLYGRLMYWGRDDELTVIFLGFFYAGFFFLLLLPWTIEAVSFLLGFS